MMAEGQLDGPPPHGFTWVCRSKSNLRRGHGSDRLCRSKPDLPRERPASPAGRGPSPATGLGLFGPKSERPFPATTPGYPLLPKQLWYPGGNSFLRPEKKIPKD